MLSSSFDLLLFFAFSLPCHLRSVFLSVIIWFPSVLISAPALMAFTYCMFNYPHLPVVYLDSVLFTLFVTSSVHFVSVHDPDAAPVPWGRLIFVSVIAFTVNRPVGTDEN